MSTPILTAIADGYNTTSFRNAEEAYRVGDNLPLAAFVRAVLLYSAGNYVTNFLQIKGFKGKIVSNLGYLSGALSIGMDIYCGSVLHRKKALNSIDKVAKHANEDLSYCAYLAVATTAMAMIYLSPKHRSQGWTTLATMLFSSIQIHYGTKFNNGILKPVFPTADFLFALVSFGYSRGRMDKFFAGLELLDRILMFFPSNFILKKEIPTITMDGDTREIIKNSIDSKPGSWETTHKKESKYIPHELESELFSVNTDHLSVEVGNQVPPIPKDKKVELSDAKALLAKYDAGKSWSASRLKSACMLLCGDSHWESHLRSLMQEGKITEAEYQLAKTPSQRLRELKEAEKNYKLLLEKLASKDENEEKTLRECYRLASKIECTDKNDKPLMNKETVALLGSVIYQSLHSVKRSPEEIRELLKQPEHQLLSLKEFQNKMKELKESFFKNIGVESYVKEHMKLFVYNLENECIPKGPPKNYAPVKLQLKHVLLKLKKIPLEEAFPTLVNLASSAGYCGDGYVRTIAESYSMTCGEDRAPVVTLQKSICDILGKLRLNLLDGFLQKQAIKNNSKSSNWKFDLEDVHMRFFYIDYLLKDMNIPYNKLYELDSTHESSPVQAWIMRNTQGRSHKRDIFKNYNYPSFLIDHIYEAVREKKVLSDTGQTLYAMAADALPKIMKDHPDIPYDTLYTSEKKTKYKTLEDGTVKETKYTNRFLTRYAIALVLVNQGILKTNPKALDATIKRTKQTLIAELEEFKKRNSDLSTEFKGKLELEKLQKLGLEELEDLKNDLKYEYDRLVDACETKIQTAYKDVLSKFYKHTLHSTPLWRIYEDSKFDGDYSKPSKSLIGKVRHQLLEARFNILKTGPYHKIAPLLSESKKEAEKLATEMIRNHGKKLKEQIRQLEKKKKGIYSYSSCSLASVERELKYFIP